MLHFRKCLKQASASQGKYFVRLITLIGSCHLVKKRKRRTALDKNKSLPKCWLLAAAVKRADQYIFANPEEYKEITFTNHILPIHTQEQWS